MSTAQEQVAGQRCEILWSVPTKDGGSKNKWIPGVITGRRQIIHPVKTPLRGRLGFDVKADCGWVAEGAHPDCVRVVSA